MASAFVQGIVKQNPVAVFAKSYCPYCAKAKQLLESQKVDFYYADLDQNPDMNKIQEYFQELTGAKTVPRVFIGGTCIGGYDATKALHDQGKLIPAIKEAGGKFKGA